MPDSGVALPFNDAAEHLFRSIEPAWIEDGKVTHDAIDLQGTSCNRESIAADPNAAMDLVGRPRETAVASITVGQAHGVVERPDGHPWEFYPAHCPERRNSAHCEIRVRRKGSSKDSEKVKSGSQKLLIKMAIASRMAIVIAPPSSTGGEPNADRDDEFG